uniref:(S)-ureidoglycine aminohydrolase cupin domain-containing protein n=1 Tax=Picocystis salinarum TaxID=88271 RepID=A0A7S3UFJ8_9CHLO
MARTVATFRAPTGARNASRTGRTVAQASLKAAPGEIRVVRGASFESLQSEGVFSWPIWTCEASEFPWTYDQNETCYLLEGEVEAKADSGETASFQAGDLVSFPAGMSCTWKVTQAVKKHYKFY